MEFSMDRDLANQIIGKVLVAQFDDYKWRGSVSRISNGGMRIGQEEETGDIVIAKWRFGSNCVEITIQKGFDDEDPTIEVNSIYTVPQVLEAL